MNSLIPLEKKRKASSYYCIQVLLRCAYLKFHNCNMRCMKWFYLYCFIGKYYQYSLIEFNILSTQNVNRLNCTTMNNSNLLWSVPICFCHYSLIENLERRGLTKIENFSLAVTTLLWSSYVLNLWIWSYRKDGQK